MVELPFMHVQVLISLQLLLLADYARETLAAALWMRRGGSNAWAAAVEHGGAAGSRRRRAADLCSSDLYVCASSWGRPPIWRVHSTEPFCASMRQHVRLSVGSARWRVREV